MGTMTTMELFLRLVRNALWQTEEELPEELSANMSANILRGGKEQGVLGLVIDALGRNKVRMPEEQHLKMMVLLMKVKQSNEEVNEGLLRLKTLFDERGIDYMVVKGQAVGTYYPDPTLRHAGDIDYYCDAKNFPKAQDAIREAWGIDENVDEVERHVHFDYKNVTYEGHFSLVMFYNKRKDRYWQRMIDNLNDNDNHNLNDNDNHNLNDNHNDNHNDNLNKRVRVNGDVEIKTLPPTIHTTFIFIHIFVHLMEQGVGFRQFCDLAVMLHACRDEIDHDRMQEILKTLGMERAYRAIGCILTDYLGLPMQDVGCELTDSDRKYTKRIIDILRYRGNMGQYNLKNGNKGWRRKIELAGITLSHFAKLWALAPDYSCRWVVYRFKKNILQACGFCRIK